MSTPDKNLEIKHYESNSNAECESLKNPIEENSRMAQEGNMSNVPTVHVPQPICIPFKKCRYVHTSGKGENRESSAVTILKGESTDVPLQGIRFEEGYLADGEDERRGYSAVKIETRKPQRCLSTMVKTMLFTQWERNGRCSYGAKSTYAHGKAELKSLDSSNPPESRSSADISAPARNVASNEIVIIAPADRRFKWNDIQKISRIYADWIE